jgi:hypothetical protein
VQIDGTPVRSWKIERRCRAGVEHHADHRRCMAPPV